LRGALTLLRFLPFEVLGNLRGQAEQAGKIAGASHVQPQPFRLLLFGLRGTAASIITLIVSPLARTG
jgi:hypothetical protein